MALNDLFQTKNKKSYTEILNALEFETRKGKQTGWAMYEGRRLTPLETDLVKRYASEEKKSKNMREATKKKIMNMQRERGK